MTSCANTRRGAAPRGPEVFYGYCHRSSQMRMMDFPEYLSNVHAGYASFYENPAAAFGALSGSAAGSSATRGQTGSSPYGSAEKGCGCECRRCEEDCSCQCCIRSADVVQYARCGEVRRIPLVFENDTRRERDVTLQLGNFLTEGGLDVGWKAEISPAKFTLLPCGEFTAVLSVAIDCSKLGGTPGDGERRRVDLDSCKVAYATLRAEGCTVCPLVIAVAVLPEHCDAHRTSCLCGCCR